MTDDSTEVRFDPAIYILDTFRELRQLYHEGHAKQIEDEVIALTGSELHRRGSDECLSSARESDAIIFDPNADVISEHLENGNEITDLAAEAIVRRLANPRGFMEAAHFNSWLETLGFAPLKRER